MKHVSLPFEDISRGRWRHPSFDVQARNSPRMVPGYSGRGLQLNGIDQYLTVAPGAICGGDLSNCTRGFTVRMRVKAESLRDGTYLVSSAPFDLYYENGELMLEFRTPARKWRIWSPDRRSRMNPGVWYLVEATWDPEEGIELYINGELMGRGRDYVPTKNYNPNQPLYIGRSGEGTRPTRHFDGVIDDFELFEVGRNQLVTRGMIGGGGESNKHARFFLYSAFSCIIFIIVFWQGNNL